MNDVLGHPITKGCTVLTSEYWSPTFNTIAKVVSVTKCYVTIEMPHELPNSITKEYCQVRTIKRKPHQMVVINKQLAYNRKTYPENNL